MSIRATIRPSHSSFRRIVGPLVCTLVMAVTAVGMWASSDRDWERAWKDRVRVETPLGVDKAFVISWIDHNCESVPHVDDDCEDALQGIPIVQLAGLRKSAVSSYSRFTVFRKDLVAGESDNMRVYHFFDSDDEVIGHFCLPLHEIETFEKAYLQLHSSQIPVMPPKRE